MGKTMRKTKGVEVPENFAAARTPAQRAALAAAHRTERRREKQALRAGRWS